ncbi:MAG: DEAD/DEAH box helicase, partial [Acholeplasma sp.]|nr:DEAD/DEAH box helicase [Acholeplasma sp.]
MKKNNPLERANMIEKEFRDYLKATLEIENTELNRLFNNELEKTELFKGPFISFSKPFMTNLSIADAINERILSPYFRQFKSIGQNFKLYEHQFQAIKQLQNNHSIVVTTGTGSGKTESFLFPILNDILKDISEGKDHKGIRAVFLYPINALVNDQLERLRQILSDYPEITFGSYTGDTPENKRKMDEMDKRDLAEGTQVSYLVNEVRHREDMRINPPQLLFTNYAMLEYILIRPSDAEIFNGKNTRNWKFIVLDEAHTYRGSLAIELSHLLRRLTGKYVKRNLQYVLTSATLGRGEIDVDEIVEFAHNLTGAKFERKNILFAKRQFFDGEVKYQIKPEDYTNLLYASEKNNKDQLCLIYRLYGQTSYESINDLYDFLLFDDMTNNILNMIDRNNVSLTLEIFDNLKVKYNLKLENFIDYIDLLSYAIKDGQNLLVCKYHIFTKTPQGAYISIKPTPKLELSKTKEKNDSKYYELGVCKFCGTPYLIGNIVSESKFITNDKTDIYENYPERESDRFRTDFLLFDRPVDFDIREEHKLVEYDFCNRCGAMKRTDNVNATFCACDSKNKVKVYHVETKNETLKNNLIQCPICDGKHQGGVVRTFNIQKDETTAILGQINIESMYNLGQDEIITDDVRRQLIAFSDSVQQATFYALFMEKNFNRFLRKRLLIEVLNKQNHKISFENAIEEVHQLIVKNNLIVSNDHLDEKIDTESLLVVLSELLKIDGKFGGEGLGIYHFRNAKIRANSVHKILQEHNFNQLSELSDQEVTDLAQVAFDHFRMMPAIMYKRANIDREVLDDELQYRSNDYFVTKIKSSLDEETNDKYTKSFLPSESQKNKNKTNKLFRYISKVYETNNTDTLTIVGSELWELGKYLGIFEYSSNTQDKVKLRARDYEIIDDKESTFFQCNHCNKVTIYNVKNVCPQDHCEGTLSKFDESKGFTGISQYYRNKYINKRIERISIEEHTGQLGKKI